MTAEENLLGQRSEKVHKGEKNQGINTNFSYFWEKKYFFISNMVVYPVYISSKYLSGAVAK